MEMPVSRVKNTRSKKPAARESASLTRSSVTMEDGSGSRESDPVGEDTNNGLTEGEWASTSVSGRDEANQNVQLTVIYKVTVDVQNTNWKEFLKIYGTTGSFGA